MASACARGLLRCAPRRPAPRPDPQAARGPARSPAERRRRRKRRQIGGPVSCGVATCGARAPLRPDASARARRVAPQPTSEAERAFVRRRRRRLVSLSELAAQNCAHEALLQRGVRRTRIGGAGERHDLLLCALNLMPASGRTRASGSAHIAPAHKSTSVCVCVLCMFAYSTPTKQSGRYSS